ncbi:hypothetical protein MRX96_051377 [Rhipicephalus microplus]
MERDRATAVSRPQDKRRQLSVASTPERQGGGQVQQSGCARVHHGISPYMQLALVGIRRPYEHRLSRQRMAACVNVRGVLSVRQVLVQGDTLRCSSKKFVHSRALRIMRSIVFGSI